LPSNFDFTCLVLAGTPLHYMYVAYTLTVVGIRHALTAVQTTHKKCVHAGRSCAAQQGDHMHVGHFRSRSSIKILL